MSINVTTNKKIEITAKLIYTFNFWLTGFFYSERKKEAFSFIISNDDNSRGTRKISIDEIKNILLLY